MNDNQLYRIARNNHLRRLINESPKSREQLEEVIKFHQATTMIPMKSIKNIEKYSEKENWKYLALDVEPNCSLYKAKKIESLKLEEISNNNSRNFIKDHVFDNQTIEYFLVNSFCKCELQENGKSYVIPLLMVLNDKAIEGISSGCYVFNVNDLTLNKIKELNDDEIIKLNSVLEHTGGILSNTAICYAIDIQKAATIYGKRGYRNVLIEVGSLKNEFEKTLFDYSDRLLVYSEFEFPDNALSNILSMNIRLAPIVLIQWFGLNERG